MATIKKIGKYFNKWTLLLLNIFITGYLYLWFSAPGVGNPTLYPSIKINSAMGFLYLTSQVMVVVSIILLFTRRKNFIRYWKWIGWWLVLFNLVLGISYFYQPGGGGMSSGISRALSMASTALSLFGVTLVFLLITEVPFWIKSVYLFVKGKIK